MGLPVLALSVSIAFGTTPSAVLPWSSPFVYPHWGKAGGLVLVLISYRKRAEIGTYAYVHLP